MDVQDKRGIVGDAGVLGDQGIVAEPLAVTPEEQAAQTAANQAAMNVVAARNALAQAEKKFSDASANAVAVAETAAAARIAKVAADRADASSAAAKAAAARANADVLTAQAAADQAAADDARKVLVQKAGAAGIHTLNGKPI